MKTTLNISSVKLQKQLSYFHQEQFSGRLEIKSSRKISWRFYFRLGRLIWGDGGEHPHRSWLRHRAKYCPQLARTKLLTHASQEWECQNYQNLLVALQRKQIERSQVKAVIQNKLAELVFDILQEENLYELTYENEDASTSLKLALMLKNTPVLINTEAVIDNSLLAWSNWIEKGLAFWSPNQIARIVKTETESQQLLTEIPAQITNLLNGTNTIRDLAAICKENPANIAAFLLPYVNQGLIQFIEGEDLENSVKAFSLNSDRAKTNPEKEELPLIVGIDDDIEVCQSLGAILPKAGYKYIGIQECWQAVSRLVSYQPDLILLDTNMPIVSGYQIINQLRRVKSLQDTPVIIMVESGAIIDRMRSKFSGTKGCITKPIDAFNLLKNVQNIILEKKILLKTQ